MRYKTLTLIVTTLMLPFTAKAQYWPYEHDSLLKELKWKYAQLESKTGFCQKLREREITQIESTLLHAQPPKKQELILHVVSSIVFERCTQVEKASYTMALMNYTSETGDKTYLNDWLILNKSYYSKEMRVKLSDIDPKDIFALAELPVLFYPFKIRLGENINIVPEN